MIRIILFWIRKFHMLFYFPLIKNTVICHRFTNSKLGWHSNKSKKKKIQILLKKEIILVLDNESRLKKPLV